MVHVFETAVITHRLELGPNRFRDDDGTGTKLQMIRLAVMLDSALGADRFPLLTVLVEPLQRARLVPQNDH